MGHCPQWPCCVVDACVIQCGGHIGFLCDYCKSNGKLLCRMFHFSVRYKTVNGLHVCAVLHMLHSAGGLTFGSRTMVRAMVSFVVGLLTFLLDNHLFLVQNR